MKKIFKSPWVGAVGSILSIAWEAFWQVGPPIGIATDQDRQSYLTWGLVTLAVCGFQSIFVLMRENEFLRNKLDAKTKLREARVAIGHLLLELAQCEKAAWDGTNAHEYTVLLQQLEKIKSEVKSISRRYLDTSFESGFLAVNVMDVELEESKKLHFISRAQGSFWTAYQQVNGWRKYTDGFLKNLGH